MSLATPELIVIFVILAVLVVGTAITVWSLVVAVRNQSWAWVVAIGISIVVGPLAPILGLVYLIAYRKNGPTPAMPPAPPPQVFAEGWYDDPGGAYDKRWWNGDAWTDQVIDAGITRTRPLSSPGPT